MAVASLYTPPAPSKFLPGTFLIAGLPDPSAYAQMYAWVTDLHDSQPDLALSDGVAWKAVRPFATRTVANANVNMTVTPLVNSPTQILKGTLTAQRTLTISTTYAYPGAHFRIKREAGGLFNCVAAGVAMAASSSIDLEYDGSAWIETASGGLL